MKKKSEEARHAILKSIRKLELAVGKAVKRSNLDNAKKQRNKKLVDELESKGT